MRQEINNSDSVFFGITNSHADAVQQEKCDREARALRNQEKKVQERKEKRSAILWMLADAGGCTALGVAVLFAMEQAMIVPSLAIPTAIACFVWAGIRLDRFFRRG